jgi:WD40 repeat protein
VDLNSGQTLHTLEGHTDWVAACTFSPDGLTALSASADGTLRVWDLKSGQTRHILKGHTWKVSTCTFSPDRKTAFSASDDGTLRLWDLASDRELYCYTPTRR